MNRNKERVSAATGALAGDVSTGGGEEASEDGGRKRLTKGTNVLSWDCGITNLCYCLLEYVGEGDREFNIVRWENFSLNAQNLKQAVEALVRELDRRPWMLKVDHVCIEAQVLKNVSMKVVSHVLQTYFVTRASMPARAVRVPSLSEGAVSATTTGGRGTFVHFIAAKSKFSVCDVETPKHLKTRRAINKRVAVLMAEKLLLAQKDTVAHKFLMSFDKKDDLSDALVQGVYFLRLVRKRDGQASRVLRHLGLDPRAPGCVAPVTRVIDLNEGCEVNSEVPLPRVYRSSLTRTESSLADTKSGQ